MAKDLKTSETLLNAQASEFATAHNNGYLRGYSLGTGGIPATIATALTDQVLLFELTFAATAFGAPSGGSVTANAMTPETSATAGTVAFYRTFASNGTTVICQGTAGPSSGDYNLELPDATIPSGAEVNVTSFVHTIV